MDCAGLLSGTRTIATTSMVEQLLEAGLEVDVESAEFERALAAS
jgi:hypothetical protein